MTAQTLRDRQGIINGDGRGDPELLKELLLVSDSCWGRPTQQAAPLTA